MARRIILIIFLNIFLFSTLSVASYSLWIWESIKFDITHEKNGIDELLYVLKYLKKIGFNQKLGNIYLSVETNELDIGNKDLQNFIISMKNIGTRYNEVDYIEKTVKVYLATGDGMWFFRWLKSSITHEELERIKTHLSEKARTEFEKIPPLNIRDITILRNFIDYMNSKYIEPAAKFAGIVFDIEPHIYKDLWDYKPIKEKFVDFMVSMVRYITSNVKDSEVRIALPFAFDCDEDRLSNGMTLLEVLMTRLAPLIRNRGKILVMSYRNSKDEILDVAENELKLGKNLGVDVELTVELGWTREKNVSFFYKDLCDLVSILNELTSENYDIGIHDYYSLSIKEFIQSFNWDYGIVKLRKVPNDLPKQYQRYGAAIYWKSRKNKDVYFITRDFKEFLILSKSMIKNEEHLKQLLKTELNLKNEEYKEVYTPDVVTKVIYLFGGRILESLIRTTDGIISTKFFKSILKNVYMSPNGDELLPTKRAYVYIPNAYGNSPGDVNNITYNIPLKFVNKIRKEVKEYRPTIPDPPLESAVIEIVSSIGIPKNHGNIFGDIKLVGEIHTNFNDDGTFTGRVEIDVFYKNEFCYHISKEIEENSELTARSKVLKEAGYDLGILILNLIYIGDKICNMQSLTIP